MKIDRRIRLFTLLASVFACAGLPQIDAAPLNTARMTYLSNDVRLSATQGVLQRATTDDTVSAGTTINNGKETRSELTFANRTVARLGDNTILNLADKPANMELREGAMFFQIPRRAKAVITTASIVVTSKNATGLLERNQDSYIKLLLIQGEARVALRHRIGESIVMKAGQILITSPKATSLPDVAYFDIAQTVRTCRLISEFPPLQDQDSIALAVRKQDRLTSKGTYLPSNLVIFGRGTLVSLVPPQPPENVGQKRTRNPQPAN